MNQKLSKYWRRLETLEESREGGSRLLILNRPDLSYNQKEELVTRWLNGELIDGLPRRSSRGSALVIID